MLPEGGLDVPYVDVLINIFGLEYCNRIRILILSSLLLRFLYQSLVFVH
jgi:hypothetical protein